MSLENLVKALAVTAEVTGFELSPGAAKLMCADLERYPEAQVMGALSRCRKELRHRLTLADILSRLEDGRPGPEEAWAKVSQTRNEGVTLVWTDEMRLAAAIAWPLISEGDMVAARMAFVERYRELVQKARDAGKPVAWSISLGHDAAGREGPIREAIELGRLPENARQLSQHPFALPTDMQPALKKIPT